VVGHTGVLKPTQVVGDKQHILTSSEYSLVRSFDTWERVQKKWIREFGPEGIAAQLVSPAAKDEKDGPEGIANQPASPIAKDEKDNVDHTLPRSCSMKGDCDRHGRCVLDAGDAASAKIAAWVRARVPPIDVVGSSAEKQQSSSASSPPENPLRCPLLSIRDLPSSDEEEKDMLALWALVFHKDSSVRESAPVLMAHCLLNPIRVIMLRLRPRPCGSVFEFEKCSANVFGFELLYDWICGEASFDLESSKEFQFSSVELLRYDFDPESWSSLRPRGRAVSREVIWQKSGPLLRASMEFVMRKQSDTFDQMRMSLTKPRHAAGVGGAKTSSIRQRLVKKTSLKAIARACRARGRGCGRGRGQGQPVEDLPVLGDVPFLTPFFDCRCFVSDVRCLC
jgi:hypothetical protein